MTRVPSESRSYSTRTLLLKESRKYKEEMIRPDNQSELVIPEASPPELPELACHSFRGRPFSPVPRRPVSSYGDITKTLRQILFSPASWRSDCLLATLPCATPP